MASVFTKIIKGEMPAFKVYEDERLIAFLAREAVALGHTLVVPKKEVDYFIDVAQADYQAVFQQARPISRAIHRATKCLKVGMAVVGLEVKHFHLHLIPMNAIGDLDFKKGKVRTDAENKEILAKIVASLSTVAKD